MRFVQTHYLILVLVLCCSVPGGAATMRGKVVPAVPETLVCLESSKDGGEVARAWASKNGSFTLKGIKPGTYEFDVIADGYAEYKAPVKVTAQGSGGLVVKLIRGAVLKGKISPVVPDERIELTLAKDRVYLDLDTDTGAYTTEVGLPSGTYQMRVTAKGYAPIEREVKLIAPKTTVLDLMLVKTGSISGRVSPAPSEGAVIAVNTERRIPLETGKIRADGSYKVEDLPAGTYDLIILAKGYERAIGWGPVPGPDTLTDKDRRDIEAIFTKADKAWADKDVDTLMALIPDKERTDAQRRELWTRMFNAVKSYSSERTFDFVVGQTGKSAIAVERVRRKLVYVDGPKDATHEDKTHLRVTLAFESGAWRITDILTLESRPEWNIPLNTRTEAFLVGAFPGEVPDALKEQPVQWRYSGDSRILSIIVEPSAESKGHDFALTPLVKLQEK